ncbi:hypothetical protein IKE86_01815 [Candidatus Saccharibacteria bacterium]|nr:hypothetical protein [Candidatus Saccharibacteria bacterium]
MHEQNSFSNLNTPDRGEAIISSSAEQKSIPAAGNNFGAIAPSQPPKDKKPLDLKVIFIAIAAALVGAGIAVAVVLIVNNLNNREEGETTEITYSSPDNDGTKQNEEVIAEYDKKIAETSDKEVELGLTLNKAGYYNLIEDYDSAISVLQGIDVSSLDNFDQYRVYNYFSTAYEGKGNSAEASRYHQLAEEANARDFQVTE